jgi:hypothetical protein
MSVESSLALKEGSERSDHCCKGSALSIRTGWGNRAKHGGRRVVRGTPMLVLSEPIADSRGGPVADEVRLFVGEIWGMLRDRNEGFVTREERQACVLVDPL